MVQFRHQNNLFPSERIFFREIDYISVKADFWPILTVRFDLWRPLPNKACFWLKYVLFSEGGGAYIKLCDQKSAITENYGDLRKYTISDHFLREINFWWVQIGLLCDDCHSTSPFPPDNLDHRNINRPKAHFAYPSTKNGCSQSQSALPWSSHMTRRAPNLLKSDINEQKQFLAKNDWFGPGMKLSSS